MEKFNYKPMNQQKQINSLYIYLSWAVVIILFGLFPLTENSENWFIILLHDLIPHFIAALGIFLILYYFFRRKGIDFLLPEHEEAKGVQRPVALSSFKPEIFGVQITSHAQDAKVEQRTIIKGSFTDLPLFLKPRVYVTNENHSLYWVDTQTMIIDRNSGTWETVLYIGGNKNAGQYFFILVALEDDTTDAWVKYYKEVTDDKKDWPGLKMPMPNSLLITNRLRVQRI